MLAAGRGFVVWMVVVLACALLGTVGFVMRGRSSAPAPSTPAKPPPATHRPEVPLAVVFVINGQEVWAGNDEVETDPPAVYAGPLRALEAAIDRSHLAALLPEGSRAAIVTYATGAQVRHQMSPVSTLTGRSFGAQRDYYRTIGTDLVSGIELGLHELARVDAERRLLVIIGDGNDTSSETAQPRLTELRAVVARGGVEVYALIARGPLSGEHDVVTPFARSATIVRSADDMVKELAAIFSARAR